MAAEPSGSVPTKQIAVRVAHPVADALQTVASRDGESLSTTIRRLLRLGLEVDQRQVVSRG
jgi:hypothetical protein